MYESYRPSPWRAEGTKMKQTISAIMWNQPNLQHKKQLGIKAENDVQKSAECNLIFSTEADSPLFVPTRQSPIDYFINQAIKPNKCLETKTNDVVWPNKPLELTSVGQPTTHCSL